MDKEHGSNDSIAPSEQELVLSTLELDQLAEVKKLRVPRRRLTRPQTLLLWALRLYLLFMMAVVLYQVITGAK